MLIRFSHSRKKIENVLDKAADKRARGKTARSAKA